MLSEKFYIYEIIVHQIKKYFMYFIGYYIGIVRLFVIWLLGLRLILLEISVELF